MTDIYEYILSGNEKHLNIRTFPLTIQHAVYEKQDGICVKCKEHFEFNQMEADHITPWHEGGKTNIENCQILCKKHNREKGASEMKQDKSKAKLGRPQKGYPKPFDMTAEALAKKMLANAKPVTVVESRQRWARKAT